MKFYGNWPYKASKKRVSDQDCHSSSMFSVYSVTILTITILKKKGASNVKKNGGDKTKN